MLNTDLYLIVFARCLNGMCFTKTSRIERMKYFKKYALLTCFLFSQNSITYFLENFIIQNDKTEFP